MNKNMQYSYADPSSYSDGGGIGVGYLFIAVLIILPSVIALWKLYNMAGKPGWAAIIPIYNIIIYIKIAGRPIWWIILLIIPIVGFVIAIILLIDFLKVYNKGGIGSILLATFFPIFYFPIIAFSKSTKHISMAKAE